jgi:hypothetical protein
MNRLLPLPGIPYFARASACCARFAKPGSFAAALAIIAAGCGVREVTVVGKVTRSHTDRDGLAGGTVEIRGEDAVVYDDATTTGDGSFTVLAPAGQTIYAGISGDGLAKASFTGVSGADPRMTVDSGLLFGVPLDDLDALRAQFDGCPGLDGAAGIVYGEVAVYGLEDPTTHLPPLVTTAVVTSISGEGTEHPACYLDADGGAWDPDAVATGQSGTFAIFGVEPGLHTLEVSYDTDFETGILSYSSVWVPDDPNGVAARFPAWVEFPF